jgi:nucleoside-diphosphate-sugar epimerase
VTFLILGAGYTGSRVADILRRPGHSVTALRSKDFDILRPETHSRLIECLTPGVRMLHSIPVLRTAAGYRATMPVLAPLFGAAPARVVYISTTGVYGDAHDVDETTPAAPRNEREVLRTEEERAVLAGPWSSPPGSAMILRAAAIYGPGRGVYESMREGRYKFLGGGANFISRIHVDDLAAVAAAALESDLQGAFPVADDYPCPAREIAEYCSRLLGVPMPETNALLADDDTRRSDRRVDGSAIRRLLGVKLRYPSYREGIPASL